MLADQAAGLRRRSARQPLRCIHCFSDSPEFAVRLAQALHRAGRVSLLVDPQGRLFAAASPRSLFDWKQQLERGQLHTLPQAYGDGWYAPGVRANDPALRDIAKDYDHVVFDSVWDSSDLALLPGAAHTVVMEIHRTDASTRHAYAVLKTLAGSGTAFGAGLHGDRLACDQVRAAACRFLGPQLADDIFSVAHEDDAFAALAVRMAREETSLTAC